MNRITTLLSVAVVAVLGLATVGPLNASDAVLNSDDAHRTHQMKHEREPSAAARAAVPSERVSDVECVNGAAAGFECSGLDLASFVPLSEFDTPNTGAAIPAALGGGLSDIWGWTDAETGGEYVIVGKTNGVGFFRVTDPKNPVYLGEVTSEAAAQLIWHDIKVVNDHAYMVSESNPYGVKVFDLTRLVDIADDAEPQVFLQDFQYPLTVGAHNIVGNEDSDTVYIVGGSIGLLGPDQCLGGLHALDVSVPDQPVFAGCFATDGYTHDAQCVNYTGPDEDYQGRELCFAFNEDTVTIVDVTDKLAMTQIAKVPYAEADYTHQGWLTEDQSYLLFNDEGDETGATVDNTTTYIMDVRDLDTLDESKISRHAHETTVIDHNLYTKDGLVYQSNYEAGLRVLSLADVANGNLDEVAWFDTFPISNETEFNGTWSNFPYFESGTIAVTGTDEGLFLLTLQEDVLDALEDEGDDETESDD